MKIDTTDPAFQKDFITSSITFLSFAMQDEVTTGAEIYTKYLEMLDPIIGNRNKQTAPFSDAIPLMYEKIIKYCNDRITILEGNKNESSK
jgi:hypothetical protein